MSIDNNPRSLMTSPIPFSVQRVTFADAAAVASASKGTMDEDRQTQLKKLGNVPYLQDEKRVGDGVRGMLRNKKYAAVKAVHNETGEVMGSCFFVFYGFDQGDIPHADLGKDEFFNLPVEEPIGEVKASDDEAKNYANKCIDRLDEMENADMKRWQEILMPPGTKCIILAGLSVAARFQHRGIGSALVKWGTDHADQNSVFMWVHSSEAAFMVYSKNGFEVVGILDVDLDAWAPGPPPEGLGEVWGHYLIRYMKRLPKRPS